MKIIYFTEQSKQCFITQHVMEGRAPLRVFGSYLVVTSRGGNNIQLHEASLDTKFKKLHEVQVFYSFYLCSQYIFNVSIKF